MFASKKLGRFCKNQVFVTVFIPFKPSCPSENEETPEISAPNLLTKLSNPTHSLAILQTSKYDEDNLERILKTVLEPKLLLASGHDKEMSKDFPEQALYLKTSDGYKNKLHIDYYNFIQ